MYKWTCAAQFKPKLLKGQLYIYLLQHLLLKNDYCVATNSVLICIFSNVFNKPLWAEKKGRIILFLNNKIFLTHIQNSSSSQNEPHLTLSLSHLFPFTIQACLSLSMGPQLFPTLKKIPSITLLLKYSLWIYSTEITGNLLELQHFKLHLKPTET